MFPRKLKTFLVDLEIRFHWISLRIFPNTGCQFLFEFEDKTSPFSSFLSILLLLRFDDIPSLLSHDASGREFLRARQTATVAQTNEGSYYILVMNTGRSDGSQTDSQVKNQVVI